MFELKPCPLCGRKITNYHVYMQEGSCKKLSIDCECGLQVTINPHVVESVGLYKMEQYYPDGDAIEIWNRRADNG